MTSFDVPSDGVPGIPGDDVAFLEPDRREPLADARIRPLLERYVAAAGAVLTESAPGLVVLRVPDTDRRAFRNRREVRIAFTLDALELDPEAEIALVGSALVEQLIQAIRLRGARAAHGIVPPDLSPSPEAAALRVPIANATVREPRVDVARHRVVRLLARVVVRAGSAVEEHLVESGLFDASTGAKVPDDVAARCLAVSERQPMNSSLEDSQLPPVQSARPMEELVPLALADLRASIEPRVRRLREEAQAALGAELRRIDGYYAALLEGAAGRGSDVPDAASRRAYESEHARRRTEEERRHQVRATVHPVQLSEWEILVQRAQWELVTARGHHGRVTAQRALSGSGSWQLACPRCGTTDPALLSVCRSGHASCETCTRRCGACGEEFCWDHGIDACHVDGRPTCEEHARVCASCLESYCTAHEALCGDGDHQVCTECIAPCAICGRRICGAHATITVESAPHGARRLCADCICYCEGGTNEPVGRDEVSQCASCGKSVCDHHRSTCAVDGAVHCSGHMRRTDTSRRLVCSRHRTRCALEPEAIHASDEVAPCTACGRVACSQHSRTCVEDGRSFCSEHVVPLRDRPGAFACTAHHTICHVDGQPHSLVGTSACPICDRQACASHRRGCRWCGRTVCVSEFDAASRRCTTCAALTPTHDPAGHLLAAAVGLLGERRVPGDWRTARDARHTVVELDLGWTRRIVFAVRHGENHASEGRSHSVLGSKALPG